MWKLVLIVALCLFRYGSLSNSENGSTAAFSDRGTDSTSPNILSTERPIESLDDVTSLPLSDLQEHLVERMRRIDKKFTDTENHTSFDTKDRAQFPLSGSISENSSKDDKTNGNVDFVVTEESSKFTFSTERPIKSLDDIIPLPLSDLQEHLVERMRGIDEQFTDTENHTSFGTTDHAESPLSGGISENSSKDVKTNGNVDSVVTVESSNFTFSRNIADGSPFLERDTPSVIPTLNFHATPDESLPNGNEEVSLQNNFSTGGDEDLIASSRSAISENSSKDVKTKGNVNSMGTEENSNFTFSTNIAGGSPFLEGATPSVNPTLNSEVTPDESLPTGIEENSRQNNSSTKREEDLIASSRSAISENSDTGMQVTTVLEENTTYVPEYTSRGIKQDQNLTEEKESSFPIPTTTQKKSYSSESLVTTDDPKSLIPVGERVASSDETISRGNNSSGAREEEPITGSIIAILQNPDDILVASESKKNFSKAITKAIISDINLEQSFGGESNYSLSALGTAEESNSSLSALGTAEESNSSLSALSTTEESNSPLSALSTTEESNSTLSALRTTRKKSFMPFSFDEKEIDSSQPTVNESLIYREENSGDYPSGYTPHNASTHQLLNVRGKSTLAENSTALVSLKSFDKLTTTSPIIFDGFPHNTLTNHMAKTTPYTQEDFGEKPSVSTSDATNPVIFDNVPEETESPPSKQLLNQTYKLILTQNCSGELWSVVYQSLNSIFNSRLNAQNSTKFMKCAWVYEFNFTSSIASPESFKDVIDLIKEKVNPDAEVSIVNYDSSVYQVSHTSDIDSGNFVVPKSFVYISAAATIATLLFMIFAVLCVRNKCKRSSTSLDLSDIPHLTLSVDDYKLAPIPRPSVSFPESNRDFLYAYSNETYSRTREDDTILTQHHFSDSAGKDFEAFKTQKDSALTLEMQTFNARGGVGRNRSQKSISCLEYSSANSWDRLKGKENGKKQGLDNPAIRW